MSLRGQVLSIAGKSLPVRWWLGRMCKADGVQVTGGRGGVDFRRGNAVVRVAPKHAFFARTISGSFDAFALGVQAKQEGSLTVADFTGDLDQFNRCRACAGFGVALEEVAGEVRLRKGNQRMLLSPRHEMYAPYLAENFDAYFLPLVPEQRDGFEVLDFSRPGILQTYRKSGLQFEMASFPEEEGAMEEYFLWYRPKTGDLVFDVGAHCGVSSYMFAQMVGETGTVVCFEPDPVNYQLLVRNIERHGLKNVRVEQVAIAAERGKVAFSSEGTVGSMIASLLHRESAGNVVSVDAWTLEDAYEKYGVPDFCKIDIEGAEIDVIAGSEEVLRKSKTNLVLDTSHTKADGTPTAAEVDAMLRRYGYRVETLAKPFLTTWAAPMQ
jgi:FkbM family methyltransferase